MRASQRLFIFLEIFGRYFEEKKWAKGEPETPRRIERSLLPNPSLTPLQTEQSNVSAHTKEGKVDIFISLLEIKIVKNDHKNSS